MGSDMRYAIQVGNSYYRAGVYPWTKSAEKATVWLTREAAEEVSRHFNEGPINAKGELICPDWSKENVPEVRAKTDSEKYVPPITYGLFLGGISCNRSTVVEVPDDAGILSWTYQYA
jgi:hypothetical protein